MTKLNPSADAAEKSSPLDAMAPFQDNIERCRQTSEKLATSCADIVAQQISIVEKAFYETLGEVQGLSPAHGPVEFFEQGAILAWRQAERSVKTFGDLSKGLSTFWFDALKSAGNAVPKEIKSRALH